jgi:DNA-directed RNA polymerase specialized sigma24 family protein
LTSRQREIGRLLLVDGVSQAEAARRLGIRGPTVSVAADRAGLREIGGLRAAAGRLMATGISAVGGAA